MDELAWGAAWMYKATGEEEYLNKAKDFFDSNDMCNSNLWFGWDNKKAGVEVLMYNITGQDPVLETSSINSTLHNTLQRDLSLLTIGDQTGMLVTMLTFVPR